MSILFETFELGSNRLGQYNLCVNEAREVDERRPIIYQKLMRKSSFRQVKLLLYNTVQILL